MFSLLEKMAHYLLRLQGIRSHIITGTGGKLHYYDARGKGKLPPILLVHGIASAGMSFVRVIQNLRKSHSRVVALDLPGHGRSYNPPLPLDAETLLVGVKEVIEAAFDEPFFLFGNSLGGAVSLRYASDHPENVLGLILSSSAGSPMTKEEFDKLHHLFQVTNRKAAKHFIEHLYHRVPWYRGIVERWLVRLVARPLIQSFFDQLTNNNHNEEAFPPEVLRALPMPVLCLWGGDEKLLPPSSYDYYKKHLPKHAEFRCPDKFPHSPHIEFPNELATEIYNFNQKQQPRALLKEIA